MKKVFIKKQIRLIEKKIRILKGELEKFEAQKTLEEKKLQALIDELISEKEKVKSNPELGFSFSAYYDAHKEKQILVMMQMNLLDEKIAEMKGVLVRQNIELKKYEKLEEMELEREKKREDDLQVKELDEFALRKKAIGE